MPGAQFILRSLLAVIGYERAHRKVWLVAYGGTLLCVACCAFLALVLRWFTEPGADHYSTVEQLKADFDAVHVIPAANLFTKLRAPLGPVLKSSSVFAATLGRERVSLYLQDAYSGFWKITPERFFAPLPPLATTTQWRYWYSNGVLSGRWDFTKVLVTPPGTSTWVSHDKFSVVLDDRNRMK